MCGNRRGHSLVGFTRDVPGTTSVTVSAEKFNDVRRKAIGTKPSKFVTIVRTISELFAPSCPIVIDVVEFEPIHPRLSAAHALSTIGIHAFLTKLHQGSLELVTSHVPTLLLILARNADTVTLIRDLPVCRVTMLARFGECVHMSSLPSPR